MSAMSDLDLLLNYIKDFVICQDSDEYGNEVACANCNAPIFEIEEGDWLECLVMRAVEHKCEKGD